MRRTDALIRVTMALMDDPVGQHWGYALSKQSGVRSGVMYPILQRMLDEGWIADGWEKLADIREKRPPRRYYQVTGDGLAALADILEDAGRDVRFGTLLGRPA